jgi:hypothetical protein
MVLSCDPMTIQAQEYWSSLWLVFLGLWPDCLVLGLANRNVTVMFAAFQ